MPGASQWDCESRSGAMPQAPVRIVYPLPVGSEEELPEQEQLRRQVRFRMWGGHSGGKTAHSPLTVRRRCRSLAFWRAASLTAHLLVCRRHSDGGNPDVCPVEFLVDYD